MQLRDIEVAGAISREIERQNSTIELIASENFVSEAVMQAQGSALTNKYAEGYAGRRYYGGCHYIDEIENIAISRLKKLFKAEYANVQPHSGSQANQAVFLALLKPSDTFLGMSLDAGGHLSHGLRANMSGKWFNPVGYGVDRDTGHIDMGQVEELAVLHKPKLIIAGGSAYSRLIDFKAFREIADKVGAHLMVDMAHFAGLVAGESIPSPLPYADVVTSTTHKTLRGPRGGIILTNNHEIAKKIDSAIFPGIQGGPLMHVIAAKAIAFGEALEPSFKRYCRNVIESAQTLAKRLQERGYAVFSGGTDNHLLLVDLRLHGLTGQDAESYLEVAGLTCNKNSIPFDTQKPTITSGIRLGSPACTTRGFGIGEFCTVGDMIADVLDAMSRGCVTDALLKDLAIQAAQICKNFPIPRVHI